MVSRDKSNSLFEDIRILINLVQTLFKHMPFLFLALLYLINLGVNAYLVEGWSTLYLLGGLILFISISIYIYKDKKFI